MMVTTRQKIHKQVFSTKMKIQKMEKILLQLLEFTNRLQFLTDQLKREL